jgi:hypothetical protein
MNNVEPLIPIFGMITTVLVAWGVGWTIAQGFKHRRGSGNADPALEREVLALREQVDLIQHQLSETHERLEFTERLLSQSRSVDQLPRG